MDLGIKNLRVLVTAGASGIGREIARAFVGEGGKVHVCDIDREALAALGKSDPKITQTAADVADRTQVARLFEETTAALGGLDVLVNNAGLGGTADLVDMEDDQWDLVLDVTLTGRTVTIVRNGVTTVDHKEIEGITGGALDANEAEPGPFYIQGDHTGGLKFRNITVSVPKT